MPNSFEVYVVRLTEERVTPLIQPVPSRIQVGFQGVMEIHRNQGPDFSKYTHWFAGGVSSSGSHLK